MTQHTIPLSDSRKLSFALYGPPEGWPVLYFHGTPSSRLEVQLLYGYQKNPESMLAAAGIRLIAVDRPGMGLSTYNSKGTLLSFADDLWELCKHLNISECSLLAWSGGGPYALAMAWRNPVRVRNVHIICGFAQHFTKGVMAQMQRNKWYFRAARYTPQWIIPVMNRLRHNRPDSSIPPWLTGLPEADNELMQHPKQVWPLVENTFREACRAGAHGPVNEAALYFEDFGFHLSEIQQPVHYWWGTEDNVVVRHHPNAVALHVPQSHLHIIKGEGHLSLYVHYFEKVLQVIAGLKDG